ncbi:alpha/beta hydrolase [Falsiroseomonas oryzae]|uniref:alpha/beta hydrolase n=1 Tax=Falsiroseomonas oryzae TaxID=2766473 RepID=UPI0022EA991F|nr:alpha/beta hydrolase [Roseomonas sp. MO-31]
MPILSAGIVAVLALGAFGTALYAFQDRLIYFPDPAPPPAPAALGLRGVEAVRLRTADGLEILGWRVAATRPDAPVVLYLHGNGGSLLHRAGRVARFQALGWGALLVQWRGYGGNPGSPGEARLAEDARAGLAALQAEGVPARRIVVWGESLGTGPAIRLAAEQPEAVGAVVLESPYTSLLALARLHYPLLPSGLLLRDRYDNLSRIAEVRAPIVILQGARDTLVPPAMGRALAAAATAPVELWEAAEAGHNEIGAAGGVEAASRFVARHLQGR